MKQCLFQTELFIPSSVEGLNKCLDVIDEIKERFGLNFDTCFRLQTVIVEAVENAFIHGNKSNRDLQVRIRFTVMRHQIVVEVEDSGEGFVLSDVPWLGEGDVKISEGGRGIFFIRKLSSDCYTLGRGNVIRIILNR